jgi:hypothetical protein
MIGEISLLGWKEPILGDVRADLDRLEQDVIAWVARHRRILV